MTKPVFVNPDEQRKRAALRAFLPALSELLAAKLSTYSPENPVIGFQCSGGTVKIDVDLKDGVTMADFASVWGRRARVEVDG